ncbi:MAG TPA: flagellar type III secretion system pore protein FliP [Candidatus Competibacteraceae bacterium]|nr:flagellar type III secretion system pore protein FliP [Candidatus Competibacteraceae bacterium]MCP5133976.1 flagellar type III secretion system pore protein FliP [Gammaproteobacteria bacterium]HPF59099.1 flagellar type III secretion system pore protein FliP [Candidatus Competibacteraceae bacterium]HRY18932.1 flagellar type III secretion system pore protein FliP [Candidatus Competibacteraceae bacterium]
MTRHLPKCAWPALSTLAGLLLILLLSGAESALAAPAGLPALTITPTEGGGETWSMSLQILALMTALTLLPSALLMMTSFTRIIIVLALLRQAIGTMQTPNNQILIGLALFLTFFIMSPVFDRINDQALAPYLNETLSFQDALREAQQPLQAFMLAQTRESDLALFTQLSGRATLESPDEVPFSLLVPAYITSELKTAFQIGFMLFMPFLIIDLVVASVLMSMGMMMLSPMMISFPFKLMLFVLVDGWGLIMNTLASSFYIP